MFEVIDRGEKNICFGKNSQVGLRIAPIAKAVT